MTSGCGIKARPCGPLGALVDPLCIPQKDKPPAPPPPDSPSRLSIFKVHGTGFGYLTLHTVSGAVVQGQGALEAKSSQSGGATYVGYGGLENSDPKRIDLVGLDAGITDIAPHYRIYLATNSSLRLDPEGGAVDKFDAELRQEYWDGTRWVYRSDPAVLTIVNMDGTAGSGTRHATVAYWTAEVTSFQLNATEIIPATTFYGASAFGGLATGFPRPISGSAGYSGDMHGVYVDPSGAEAASGSVALTVDFDNQTVDGRVSNIIAGSQSLRDVLLAPAPAKPLAPTDIWSLPFSGNAVTDAARPGQTGPAMSGTYVVVPSHPDGSEVAGAFSVTDGTSGLAGAFVGGKSAAGP